MKRIIAAVLVFVLMLSLAMPLSGCVAVTQDMALTMGQWVSLIAESFGMQNYQSETPYFRNVKQDNTYFAAFQMAAEWEILEPSEHIQASTAVKYKDVLITLVNAGGFLPTGATEEEKINYAIDHFDLGIRKYWMDRYIKLNTAVELLDTAQKLWAEKPIEKTVNEAVFKDNVKDYLKENVEYTVEDGVIKVPASQIGELNDGDIFALPCSGDNAAMIKRAANVTYDGDYAYIQHEEVPDEELEKYCESVVVEDSTEVDFSNIIGIYDEDGNPIVFDEVSYDDSELSDGFGPYVASNLVNTGDNAGNQAVNTGIFDKANGKFTFNIKGNKITLSLSGESFGITWSKDTEKKNNQYRDSKITKSVSVSCDKIKLDKQIDISWGKLKYAKVKIDYATKIEGGVKITTNNKVGQQDGDGSEVKSSIKSIVSGYKDALKQITTGVKDTKYTNDSVYICRIKLATAGFAAVDFIVKGVVTVTGEMKLVVQFSGSQGVEYKNGNVRYINTKKVDTNFVAEGKIEATISPGFAITVLEKWVIGEILLDLGVGVSAKYTAHLFDAEMHHIHTETGVTLSNEDIKDMEDVRWNTSAEELEAFAKDKGGEYVSAAGDAPIEILKGACLEIKIYPIIRLNMGDGLLPNLLKSAKISLSYTFMGEKDVHLTVHLDFGPGKFSGHLQGAWYDSSLPDQCMFKFVPWDENQEESPLGPEEPTIDQSDILTTESITLSTIRLTLKAGETGNVAITGLPKGYTLEDITAESEDEKIATIDTRYGEVKAHDKEGTTLITVMTRDGKHKVAFAVTVVSNSEVEFDELSFGGENYGVYSLYAASGSVLA